MLAIIGKAHRSVCAIVSVLLSMYGHYSVVHASVVPAASCSHADVSEAIVRAAANDTVTIPPGNCTWKSRITITKGLSIIGSGSSSTSIQSDYSSVDTNTFNENNFLIAYVPSNPTLNEAFRISGLTLSLNAKCGGIMLRNPSAVPIRRIRIDNNVIENGTFRGIVISGTVYGVIDKNTFSYNAKQIDSYGADTIAWKNLTFEYGSSDCMYYEDNYFNISDTPHSGGAGGRYCARYNSYTYTNATADIYPWYDMHGNQAVGNTATMGGEIYGNVLTMASPRAGLLFGHRGGKAIIFHNVLRNTRVISAHAREEYSDSISPPPSGPSGQPQHVSDSYYWNNRFDGGLVVATASNYNGVEYSLTENIDFYNHKIVFDGRSGVGCGLLAQRPTTCSPGVAYWATEQDCSKVDAANVGAQPATPISGVLYKCTAANTWSLYFVPYQYPHPLTMNLSAPLNLRIP